MLTAERLLELLHYNRETGEFLWRKNPRQKAITDLVAGTKGKRYVQICIAQKLYYAHRLAWLFVHGKWPTHDLDHINGDGRDNRIANLREATASDNLCNIGPRSDNSTGFKGVFPKCKKFSAQIRKDGVRLCLGTFETPQEAHAAYCEAARKLHGEFAGGLS